MGIALRAGIVILLVGILSSPALASTPRDNLLVPAPTEIPAAILCLVVFLLSYLVVMTEEATKLRKSKPVILGASCLWAGSAW